MVDVLNPAVEVQDISIDHVNSLAEALVSECRVRDTQHGIDYFNLGFIFIT